MHRLILLSLLIGAVVAPGPSVASSTPATVCAVSADGTSQCCKVCRRGKACGNSCINRRLTCHRGRGCACNG